MNDNTWSTLVSIHQRSAVLQQNFVAKDHDWGGSVLGHPARTSVFVHEVDIPLSMIYYSLIPSRINPWWNVIIEYIDILIEQGPWLLFFCHIGGMILFKCFTIFAIPEIVSLGGKCWQIYYTWLHVECWGIMFLAVVVAVSSWFLAFDPDVLLCLCLSIQALFHLVHLRNSPYYIHYIPGNRTMKMQRFSSNPIKSHYINHIVNPVNAMKS